MNCCTLSSAEVKAQLNTNRVSRHASRLHYIILDEVDNLRTDTQKFTRGFVTEHDNFVFIMTANNKKKIDRALVSRSHCISFENPSQDLWLKKCKSITEASNMKIDDDALLDIISSEKCDARAILVKLDEMMLLEA